MQRPNRAVPYFVVLYKRARQCLCEEEITYGTTLMGPTAEALRTPGPGPAGHYFFSSEFTGVLTTTSEHVDKRSPELMHQFSEVLVLT